VILGVWQLELKRVQEQLISAQAERRRADELTTQAERQLATAVEQHAAVEARLATERDKSASAHADCHVAQQARHELQERLAEALAEQRRMATVLGGTLAHLTLPYLGGPCPLPMHPSLVLSPCLYL